MNESIRKSLEKIAGSLTVWNDVIGTMVNNGEDVSWMVSISNGNTKMGKVASVSQLPIVTCPHICHGTCGIKCYARKLCNLRPSVLNSYTKNTVIAKFAIDQYFMAIDKACKNVKYFRFHVSGDIPNKLYFEHMVKTAINNPSVSFLCFTKQFEIVNSWIESNGEVPENLHILFSGWENMKPNNPNNFPETTVYNTENDIKPEWTLCGGNCLNCAIAGTGCWTANKGETIAFKIH